MLITRWCEERWTLLHDVNTSLGQLNSQREQLTGWMSSAEERLKQMELNTSLDTQQLLDQVKQVLVSTF